MKQYLSAAIRQLRTWLLLRVDVDDVVGKPPWSERMAMYGALALWGVPGLIVDALSWFHIVTIGDQAMWMLNIVRGMVGIGVLAWILRRSHASWASLGLRSPNGNGIDGVVVGITALTILTMIANPSGTMVATIGLTHGDVRALSAVVVAPIVEELWFRGLLFPMWGIAVSSIVFGLAHAGAYNVVFAVLIGWAMCRIYMRYDSIWPCMFVHALINYRYLIETGLSK